MVLRGGLGLKARSTKVTAARTLFPFTRASSAGLTGKRVIGCLRSEATSFMTPRQTEQRSEPEGPRSRVPGGIAKGGRASGPPWLAVKAKGEQESGVVSEPTVRCCWPHGHGMPWPLYVDCGSCDHGPRLIIGRQVTGRCGPEASRAWFVDGPSPANTLRQFERYLVPVLSA